MQHALDLSMMLNDHMAACVATNPNRFVGMDTRLWVMLQYVARLVASCPNPHSDPVAPGLGTLPMQSPELACQELRRCITELGLAGVQVSLLVNLYIACSASIFTLLPLVLLRHSQIGSHVNARALSDPALFCVFKTAAELGVPIFIHPWDMLGQELMRSYFLPWLVGMPAETSLAICSLLFGGVLERCACGRGGRGEGKQRIPAVLEVRIVMLSVNVTLPTSARLPDLRVCFAHGGGAFPGTLGRIQHGFDVRPDLCAGE